eukprot:scaffold253501_cov31-Tisochrysis_lutea.AAC.2
MESASTRCGSKRLKPNSTIKEISTHTQSTTCLPRREARRQTPRQMQPANARRVRGPGPACGVIRRHVRQKSGIHSTSGLDYTTSRENGGRSEL